MLTTPSSAQEGYPDLLGCKEEPEESKTVSSAHTTPMLRFNQVYEELSSDSDSCGSLPFREDLCDTLLFSDERKFEPPAKPKGSTLSVRSLTVGLAKLSSTSLQGKRKKISGLILGPRKKLLFLTLQSLSHSVRISARTRLVLRQAVLHHSFRRFSASTKCLSPLALALSPKCSKHSASNPART